MPDRLTAAQLDEFERLEKAATPRPWIHGGDPDQYTDDDPDTTPVPSGWQPVAMCGDGASVAVATLDGSMGDEDRLATIQAFKSGRLQVLISKPVLLGYGLNLQNCRSMVFSGIDDSFERKYQAIRRAFRFGQTETVRVHIPYVRELEGMSLENVRRKEQRFDEETRIQEENYRCALAGVLE